MTRSRAMTLVEVIAALAILVVLSGGVVSFFVGVTDRRDDLARLAAQQRDVAALLDRLEGGLMTAMAVAPDGSAGIRGDERSLTLAARGVGAAFDGPESVGDAAWVELRFDEAAGRCDLTVRPASGQGTSLTEPVLSHVERMRFRYLRGRAWSQSYDSVAALGLPAAVEVSIWLAPRTERRSASPASGAAAAQGAGEGVGADPLMPLVPPDLPAEEEAPWKAREPDHTRVIVVPDAPGAGWEGPPDA